MGDLVSRARELAHCAHAGQADKAGRPYIEHVARVAAAVADDPEAEAVAWLHDVLEDCRESVEADRLFYVFDGGIAGCCVALNRNASANAGEYYERIRKCPRCLRVKLADIADNADESRLALLDEATADRLRRKYAKALRMLAAPEDRRGV